MKQTTNVFFLNDPTHSRDMTIFKNKKRLHAQCDNIAVPTFFPTFDKTFTFHRIEETGWKLLFLLFLFITIVTKGLIFKEHRCEYLTVYLFFANSLLSIKSLTFRPVSTENMALNLFLNEIGDLYFSFQNFISIRYLISDNVNSIIEKFRKL